MPDTMMLPMMHRAAELAPSSFDAASRTVDVLWSTGATVRRTPFFGDPYDEALSLDPGAVHLDRLNSSAPFLRDHEHDDVEAVIGAVVPGSTRIGNGAAVSSVRFSDREDVAGIVADIEAGILRSVSVGYSVQRYTVTQRDGQPDLYTAVEWTPMEISVVPIGADPGAGFRSVDPVHACAIVRDGAKSTETVSEMPSTPAPVAEPEIAADAAVVETRSVTADATTTIAAAPDVGAMVSRALNSERERIASIGDLVSRAKLDRSVADDLIRSGATVDAARSAVLDALVERSNSAPSFPHIAIPLGGLDEKVTRREAAVTALLHRHDPSKHAMTDAAREFRSMSLVELARDFLAVSGERVRGLDKGELVQRAMSTSDYPNVLSAVTNKTLRMAYEAAPRTFTSFCRQVMATDFKTMNRVQLGGAPVLEVVNESGEYKRGTLQESNEAYKIKTYGKIVSITRQVIINDDLDAFSRVPALFGNSIANLESDTVWGIITANAAMSDGVALFHATHKNLGTPAVVTAAYVAEAVKLMSLQKDLDGKTVLGVRPRYLIAPVGKLLEVSQLITSITPAQTSNVVPEYIRALTPITEPRLDANSSTAWYMAADPAQIDTIEYAYLEGQQGAYTEQRMGFNVDGIEIKCRLDFGAKAIDFRGLVKNAGV